MHSTIRRRCRWPLAWLVLAGSLDGSLDCRRATGTEPLDPARFQRTTVAADLKQPMEFDIAADGTIFLIELAGRIKTIDPATGAQRLIGELNVTTEQENGLIGLALAPDFADSGWIYLQYSPPDFSGQRISRFLFRDDQLVVDSEQRLLEYEEQRRECCHHAGSMEFGPDGCLYIGTGDNTNPFDYSDGYADRRSSRSRAVGCPTDFGQYTQSQRQDSAHPPRSGRQLFHSARQSLSRRRIAGARRST